MESVINHSQPLTRPPGSRRLRVCQVLAQEPSVSETFLRDVGKHLAADVTVLCGLMPTINGRPALSQSAPARAFRAMAGYLATWEVTKAYVSAFRQAKPDVVLAEYGPVGVRVAEACRIAGLPLVVRFHGYDASMKEVLTQYGDAYRRLFDYATGVIGVSKVMVQRLQDLGAAREKVHYCPYGADCTQFRDALPGEAPVIFLATGRFVDKKAPYLTLLAFGETVRAHPGARLRMIGDGPLLATCQDLAEQFGLAAEVAFLGRQPHTVVRDEMKRVRAFIQHSVEARNGDCEGTPVGIIEAGASGLPVVSTLHAGIADVVVDGSTGFLVDERDVRAMADRMIRLIDQPTLAAELGRNARRRIETEFSLELSMERLHAVLAASAVVQ